MRLYFFLVSFLFFSCISNHKMSKDWSAVESVFTTASDTIQTSVYWYWISDNISKEGIIKDLHAMKKVGINRAFIGNIGLEDIPKEKWGKVNIFSDQWWEVVHTALKTATELNIEIGMFNGPGWSQSGGPWVKENQAMRYLYAADTLVKGGTKFSSKVGNYPTNLQLGNVLAFKVPKDYHSSLANNKPQVHSNLEGSLGLLTDKQYNQSVMLTATKRQEVTFSLDKPFSARSLTIHPHHSPSAFNVTLEAKHNGQFTPIKTFRIDRTNPAVNVGFDPYAPTTISFDVATSEEFRLIFDQISGNAGISEIELTTTPRIEHIEEKGLAKMHPTPLPYWHHYMWDTQAESSDPEHAVNPSQVKNLTDQLSKEGVLEWTVPAGEWIILQTGMLPTGSFNAPAAGGGQGLEIDKMSEKHVQAHFDNFIGEVLRRVPEEDRKTFKVVVQDSYETGGQNWTDDFDQKFEKAFGYDPKPYLPAYYGFVVGSQNESDRFLWDMRRFVADQVAYEFVGGFRKISHKHGLRTWLENYGHWGFPGEFLQYGGQSDEIGGEFWSEGELGDIENRAASSAAHIYGKTKVSAESFTSAGNVFGRYPAMFKERGDRFFAEGINNTLLHVYIHQPDDRLPGVNAWFGNDFNRSNTWFYEMGGFISYLKRTNFLLQQGTYIADVAYFIGEDAPKMTGIQQPAMPKGYDFDYMNAEVIQTRMRMLNGRFTLPDGMSYKILVLPPLETMRPELLKKIEELVKLGGTVLGPKPLRSPSLENHTQADQQVQQIADKLWGNIDGKTVKVHKYGAGMVLNGLSLQEALLLTGTNPDVQLPAQENIHYIHRQTPEGGDIYFLSNQSGQASNFKATFRTSGKQPELWDALSGQVRDLPEYEDTDTTITVPLELAAQGSAFLVFRKEQKHKDTAGKRNFPKPKKIVPIPGNWKVTFKNPDSTSFTKTFTQLWDWSKHPDKEVNYFSGSATYETTLPQIETDVKKQRLVLDLGHTIALARVFVNGKDVGSVWSSPYEIDITDFCNEQSNTIAVKVTNTWANGLIGDAQQPESQRKLWTIVNPYKANSPLHSAGLLGPVSIKIYEDNY